MEKNPVADLFYEGEAYAQYVFKLILRKRGLAFFDRVRHLLGKFQSLLKFECLEDLQSLMSDWFYNGNVAFVKTFFAPEFRWTKHMLLTFLQIPFSYIPPSLTKEQMNSFLESLKNLIFDVNFNQPEMDSLIYKKIAPYFTAHVPNGDYSELNRNFNLRFNYNFKFQMPEKVSKIEYVEIVMLLVFASKYDVFFLFGNVY